MTLSRSNVGLSRSDPNSPPNTGTTLRGRSTHAPANTIAPGSVHSATFPIMSSAPNGLAPAGRPGAVGPSPLQSLNHARSHVGGSSPHGYLRGPSPYAARFHSVGVGSR